MGLYQKQFWKNFEENFEKINRGDPFLKNLPWGTKGKNLKKKFEKNYFQFFFKIFLSLYFFQSQVGLFQKKFWKNSEENSEKINRGTLSWKTYLGGPKEKIWKKNLKKIIFNFFLRFFFHYIFFNPKWDFFKKNSGKILKKILRKSIGGTLTWKKPTLGDQRKKSEKKKFEKKICLIKMFRDIWFA